MRVGQPRLGLWLRCPSVPSPDSDYDVRFIYCHPPAWYLRLDEGPDSLSFPVDDLLDLGGWELRKTLRLLRHSSAALLEWLQSPIVYHEALGFRARLAPLLPAASTPAPACTTTWASCGAGYRTS